LADTLRSAGQMREAFAQYDEAVRLDPKVVSSWVGGAEALLALGDTDQARDWLSRAKQVHPAQGDIGRLAARLDTK
ncbi:MAG: tetratricopeptide repeat protein, partial [Vicinamibacterales bacterium]